MNFYVTIVDTPPIAATDAQTKPAITAQSVPAYIAKRGKNLTV
jgi:hypothetical protein